jgi:hypothetical protein
MSVNVSQRQSLSKAKSVKANSTHRSMNKTAPYLATAARFALGVRIGDQIVGVISVLFSTRAIQTRRRRGGRLIGPWTAGSAHIR